MAWSKQALDYMRTLSFHIKHQDFIPFFIGNIQCGIIQREFIKPFEENDRIFEFSESAIKLKEEYSTLKERNKVMEEFFLSVEDYPQFNWTLRGWRNETYSLFKDGFGSEIILDLERAAVPILGCKSYGVHLNGYIIRNGEILMWLAKRGPNKAKFPDCWDNLVGGGISTGYGVWDTLVKEAGEEASIPLEIMSRATPVGAVSYTIMNKYGTSPEVEFVYDLELPEEFEPINADGTVAGFELMTIEQVKETAVTDSCDTLCAGIVIDFLIRHGLITPDNTPDYVEILTTLHTKHPF